MESDGQISRTLAQYVETLQASGRYTFTREEASRALDLSPDAQRRAVLRLVDQKRLAVPRRGFYVVVPLEYRSAGSPPAPWYIDDLMRHLGAPYYVGVLTAASLYGAAHQQPQEFQVVTSAVLRPVVMGRTRIRFLRRLHLARAMVIARRTDTGNMTVSTAETTAIDLVRYMHAAGGLSNVATVVGELAETLDAERLVEAARLDGEMACIQRLGYLLETTLPGDTRRTESLASWVEAQRPKRVVLCPGRPARGCVTERRWNVVVNEKTEPDQ